MAFFALLLSAAGSSGSGPQLNAVYYLLSAAKLSGDLPIMGLSDSATVVAGEYREVLGAHRLSSVPAGSLRQGRAIESMGHLAFRGTGSGPELVVPSNLAGTLFVVPHRSTRQVYRMLSPDRDAHVTIAVGSKTLAVDLTRGHVRAIRIVAAEGIAGIVRSDQAILLGHEDSPGTVPGNAEPVPPAAMTLYGFSEHETLLGAAEDATLVTVYADGTPSAQYPLRAGEQLRLTPAATDAGVPLRVVANKPVAVSSTAGGQGGLRPFLSEEALGTRYGVLEDSESISVACGIADTVVSLQLSGKELFKAPCVPVESGPGKMEWPPAAVFGGIPAGTLIDANHPIYVISKPAGGAAPSLLLSTYRALPGLASGASVRAANAVVAAAAVSAPQLDAVPATTPANPFTVTGSAAAGSEVRLYVNGKLQSSVVADTAGRFALGAALLDGRNAMFATVAEGAGESGRSNAISVRYINTLAREQGGTITGDAVWTKGTSGPYVITQNLIVAPGARLTIQAGAELRFSSRAISIVVNGELVVRGTEQARVRFTSGQLNRQKNDWYGIQVKGGTARADLDYATIEYGNVALTFDGGGGTLRNTEISHHYSTGIWVLAKGNPQITDGNAISDNEYGVYVQGDFTVAGNPLPVVTGSALYNNRVRNYYATSFANPSSTVLNATGNWWGTVDLFSVAQKIYDRRENPGSSPAVEFGGYLTSPGGVPPPGLKFLSGTVATNTVLSAGMHDVLGSVLVPAGVTLTVGPGAILRFPRGAGLVVEGSLVAAANAGAMAIFTSGRETPQARDWNGIEIRGTDATVDIRYAQITYAANALVFNGSSGSIKRSRIRNNGAGIWVRPKSRATIVEGNEITANTWGIYVEGNGREADNPTAVANGNSLYGNTEYDYYTLNFGAPAAQRLDATGNWWGTSFPSAIGQAIFDQNDTVSSPLVDYGAYLASADGAAVRGVTFLSGAIANDLTLRPGRYEVNGRLAVPVGVTLTVNSGAQLLFNKGSAISVEGSLKILGSPDRRAVFDAITADPKVDDWNGIKIHAGASNVVIQYADIRHATAAIEFIGGTGRVSHSILRGNTYGVLIGHGSNSRPIIEDGNEIAGNSYGVYVAGNRDGAQNPLPRVSGNNIFGNSRYAYYAIGFGVSESVLLDATGNWWGNTNPDEIGRNIFDRIDNPSSSPGVDFGAYVLIPPQPGSERRFLGGNFQSDTLLDAGVYEAESDLAVPRGVTLTIPAGTVLHLPANRRLLVNGRLVVQGTARQPVSFTSASPSPSRGDWAGIEVRGPDAVLELAHATVEYAVVGISFNGGGGQVTGCRIRNNSGAGIRVLSGSAPLISDGNEITLNEWGIYVQGNANAVVDPAPVVTGNAILENRRYDYAALSFADPAGATLDATGNWWGTTDPTQVAVGVYERGDDLSSPAVDYSGYLDGAGGKPVRTLRFILGDLPGSTQLRAGTYQVTGDIRVPEGGTLTLGPGAVLSFVDNYRLLVDGTLRIAGTEASPVVLTSASPSPAAGDWRGVEVHGRQAALSVDHARIEYADRGVSFDGGGGLVRHSIFRNNTTGIYVTGGSKPLIKDGNLITANQNGLSVQGNGDAADNPAPLVNGNSLYGNSSYDYVAQNFGAAAETWLDATENWWGTVSTDDISGKVRDSADAAQSPTVDYSAALKGPGREATLIARISRPDLLVYRPLSDPAPEFSFYLGRPATATLNIYTEADARLVRSLSRRLARRGRYSLAWDGKDGDGKYVRDEAYVGELALADGVEVFNHVPSAAEGIGSGSGSIPRVYDPYRNDDWKIDYTNSYPGRVRMRIKVGSREFHPIDNVPYEAGTFTLRWDGRDPEGAIVDKPVEVYFYAPVNLRPEAILVRGAAPTLGGTGPAPTLEVKSDPYQVVHSYDQSARIAFRVSDDARVTVKLLPPGVVDPQASKAVTLLANELKKARNEAGQAFDHQVEWRGYVGNATNNIGVDQDGPYTFTIEATGVRTGIRALYRGNLNVVR